MEFLLLTTPAQHQSFNPAVELNPKRLQKWLSSLPAGDVIATVKQLHSAIAAFNEMPVEAAERILLLEIYHETFENIVRNYDDMRIRQLRITSEQRASLAEDIMWLYLELSQGYKIIVKNCFESDENVKGDGVLIASLFRALELISLGLIYAFRLRAAAPPLAFLELNQLFAFAERLNVEDKRVRLAKGYAKTPSISDLYKLIMLISVADPYKLDPAQIEPLYYAIQPFAQHCLISAAPSTENSPFTYSIHLIEDHQPCSWTDNEADDFSRSFNIYPALKEMQAWMEKHKNAEDNFIYEQEQILLSDFLQLFFPVSKIDLPDQTNILIGIENFHKLLSIKNSDQNSINSIFRRSLSTWKVTSKNGNKYKMVGQLPNVENLSIGAFVTLLPEDLDTGHNSIVIALIRKIQKLENKEHSLEVDCLSHHGVPITYSVAGPVAGNTNNETKKYLGVYIPKELDTNPHATLLVEKNLYEPQQLFNICASNQCYTVRTKEVVNANAHHVMFRFSVINNDKN